MTGDKLIERYGQMFAWDPRIELDPLAEEIVGRMLGEIATLGIAADYRISAIARHKNGRLHIDHNINMLPEGPARDVLKAIIAYADDRLATRSMRFMRQKETLDKIGEHRKRHREHLIEAARATPFAEKIHCGAGWIPILVDFVTAADKYPGFVLVSAKEKWGILDLDWHVDPSAAAPVRALEQEAVDEASRTCEVCEADGIMRTEGWRKTLCDRHALERRLQLTETEAEQLMEEFSAAEARWRPVLNRHRGGGVSSDQLFESFMKEFEDLDTVTRRFWSVNLTRIILARREKD